MVFLVAKFVLFSLVLLDGFIPCFSSNIKFFTKNFGDAFLTFSDDFFVIFF